MVCHGDEAHHEFDPGDSVWSRDSPTSDGVSTVMKYIINEGLTALVRLSQKKNSVAI
jgi:hypothetical protein